MLRSRHPPNEQTTLCSVHANLYKTISSQPGRGTFLPQPVVVYQYGKLGRKPADSLVYRTDAMAPDTVIECSLCVVEGTGPLATLRVQSKTMAAEKERVDAQMDGRFQVEQG
jgi:hypothetical protein